MFFYPIFRFFGQNLDIFLLMQKTVTLHGIGPIVLAVLGLSVVLLTGCKTETQSRPVPSSSSVVATVVDSAIVDSAVLDTAIADTAVADTVVVDTALNDTAVADTLVQSSSSESSSSSVAESSSAEAELSSSSETAVDSVPQATVDSSVQEVALEEPLPEVTPDTAMADTVMPEAPKDTSLCADAPAAVLCDKRDGQMYRTVRIGSQVWMAQNLNHAVENSWCYMNSLENCSNYGRLYQWTAAMALDNAYGHSAAGDLLGEKHQGICPDGWYIPTDKDMETLAHYVVESNKAAGLATEDVGTSLRKESGWEENDEEILGTNRYGFGAVPAGYRDANGSFAFLGEEADFWVAEETSNGTQAPHWNLYYANQTFSGEFKNLKTFAFSVRCVKK